MAAWSPSTNISISGFKESKIYNSSSPVTSCFRYQWACRGPTHWKSDKPLCHNHEAVVFFLVNMILYAHWRTSSRCQATLPHHLRRWWMQGPHNRRSGCPSTITNERFLLQNESNQCTFVVYSFGNETMFFFRFPWSKYILWDFESYYTHWKDLKPPATSSCGEGSHRSRDCGSQSETQNRFSLIVPTEHKFPRKFDSWSTFHVRYLQYLTLRTDSPSCCQSSVLKLFFCFTGVLRLRIRWPRKIRLSRFVSTSARP